MTDHITLPDSVPTEVEHEVTTGPEDRDDPEYERFAEALGRCPVFESDTPGGCG
jgi:hypothetical protein